MIIACSRNASSSNSRCSSATSKINGTFWRLPECRTAVIGFLSANSYRTAWLKISDMMFRIFALFPLLSSMSKRSLHPSQLLALLYMRAFPRLTAGSRDAALGTSGNMLHAAAGHHQRVRRSGRFQLKGITTRLNQLMAGAHRRKFDAALVWKIDRFLRIPGCKGVCRYESTQYAVMQYRSSSAQLDADTTHHPSASELYSSGP